MQVTSSGAVRMLASMKDHKAAVNAITVSPRTGAEAVSASSDGCCIVWDLETMKRRTSFYSNTFFKSVSYHPDESQVRFESLFGLSHLWILVEHSKPSLAEI